MRHDFCPRVYLFYFSKADPYNIVICAESMILKARWNTKKWKKVFGKKQIEFNKRKLIGTFYKNSWNIPIQIAIIARLAIILYESGLVRNEGEIPTCCSQTSIYACDNSKACDNSFIFKFKKWTKSGLAFEPVPTLSIIRLMHYTHVVFFNIVVFLERWTTPFISSVKILLIVSCIICKRALPKKIQNKSHCRYLATLYVSDYEGRRRLKIPIVINSVLMVISIGYGFRVVYGEQWFDFFANVTRN